MYFSPNSVLGRTVASVSVGTRNPRLIDSLTCTRRSTSFTESTLPMFTPRYFTRPLIVTFPSKYTLPRTLRMWFVASQSSSPTTEPEDVVVRHE